MRRSFTVLICIIMLAHCFVGCGSGDAGGDETVPVGSSSISASETDVSSMIDIETVVSETLEVIESELTDTEEDTETETETEKSETVASDTVESVTAGVSEDTTRAPETSKVVTEKPKSTQATKKPETTATSKPVTTEPEPEPEPKPEPVPQPEPVYDGEVRTKHFRLKTPDGLSIRAAYTYLNDGKKHPAVLLITGVGESNLDGAAGTLAPNLDIAEGLAERGINSLRMDKRNLWYMDQFKVTDGIEKEYLIDCRMGIQYLKDQEATDGVYLFGHSFGGQIASVLANEDRSIRGIIAFHSTARHVADLLCDRYILDDPAKRTYYENARRGAMNATTATSNGTRYLHGTDYYWSSVNEISMIDNVFESNVPLLVINSTADPYCFDEDIDLWYEHFESKDNVKIIIDDKMSHTGYEIDMTDPNVFDTPVTFPAWVLDEFASFIKKY